jgi:hypothetical protein
MAGVAIVAPMTALWNQDFPYNYYAPLDGGTRSYAGCVATAMSMSMYYWRWPWQGERKKTHTPPNCKHGTIYPELEANCGETFYDYNGMYGTPQITADKYFYEPIALLQYHTAITVNMAYCKDGSGSQSNWVSSAMRTYFKYDENIRQVLRQNTAFDAWVSLLKEQLDLRQPLYASGQASDGGHAFTCDGYDSNNLFHFNFGWSGSGNGYFVADKPAEFTSYVAVITNFIPDRSKGYPIDCNGHWTLSYMKGMITDCSEPAGNYPKGVTTTWLIDPSIAGESVESISITCNSIDLALGDYLRIYDGDNDSAPLLGKENTGQTPFDKVTSTGNKVLVKFTSTSGSATGKGFLIAYEAKPAQYCTGDIT